MTQGDWFNVCLDAPTTPVNGWQDQAALWTALGREVGSISEFNPLTLKARYVTGIILGACRSVTILLDGRHLIETTFYPAYVVFASAVELLGRCIRGNSSTHGANSDLKAGFKWLAAPKADSYESVTDNDILIKTTNYEYPVSEMVNLRHFCAHGQGVHQSASIEGLLSHHNISGRSQPANQPQLRQFDYLILGEMPPLIGNGMEAYLKELQLNKDFANSLASAQVTPYRNRPIFDSMGNFTNSILPAYADTYPAAIGDQFRQMDWTYKGRSRAFG